MNINVVTNQLDARVDHAERIQNAREMIAKITNATTVRKDDFEQILAGVKMLQELELPGIMDLKSRGLVVGASITDTIVTQEYELDLGDASQGMEYGPEGADQTRFGYVSTPNPLIWKDFQVPFRQEGFNYKSQIGGSRAMRKVMEAYENNLFNGNSNISVTVDGTARVLYGYTNHPNRATETISDWASATTNTLANVRSMLDEMFNTNKITPAPGSIMMYVATNLWMPLTTDAFSAKGDRSFREQILYRHPEIADIKPSTKLTASNVVMVSMQPDHVALAEAQAPVVIPHIKTVDLAPMKWTAYACGVPIIYVDGNSKTGIVHGST